MTRSAAEIAAGLAAPRPGRPIAPGTRIHVLGVGGAATAGAALHAHHAGAVVTGCDAGGPDPVNAAVVAAGIPVDWRHDRSHVVGTDGAAVVDRLAVTKAVTSVQPDHPEIVAARSAGIEPESVQQVIADAAATGGRRLVAVTGTHGKSTTTALLGHLLIAAGMDPTVEVGAFMAEWGATVRPGNGAPFVVEADEFGDNFTHYHPAAAIVTTVEMDHPDYFADAAAVMSSFERFARGMDTDPALGGRLLLTAARDPGADELVAALADEAADHAERVALEQRGRDTIESLARPTYEIPFLADGVDVGALYDLAETLRGQGFA